MATHCSILAWKIPWTEEPGGQGSMGLKRVGHDLATEQRVKGFLVDGMLSESWGDSIIRSSSTSHSSGKRAMLGVLWISQWLSPWAAITEYQRLGGLETAEIYLSWSWRLGSQSSLPGWGWGLVRPLFCLGWRILPSQRVLIQWSKMEWALQHLFMRTLIPLMRDPPSSPETPEHPPLTTVTLGLGFLHKNLVGTQILLHSSDLVSVCVWTKL